MSDAQDDEGLDVFSLDFVGTSDDRGFRNCRMTDECAFNISGANAMPGNVQHIVGAPYDGEVSIFIADGHVAGCVCVRNLTPVESIAGGIAVNRAEHMGEGTSQHKQSAFVRRKF